MSRTVSAEDVPRFNVSDAFSIVPVGPVPYSGFQVFGIFAFFPFILYCSLSAACGYTAGVCLEVSDWVLEIDLADHLLCLLDLKVNLRLRNALLAISLLGVVRVSMMSVVRLYYVIRAFYTKPADPHYSLGYTTDTVEINLAIITASVPALWPLRPPLVSRSV
ncbi:hypothetical protein QBC46DRAFT_346837 [Diplogelasinospora grovesii]|uniref:Rhodopsin domain-containing protein n=1 Tax=Diplogelasinospora grovesii TaxID=303347 RepID=A0AAN6MXD2_9PEZI|nr:hypothetical protein QBC46DRAFT_346837 [Diplogelasinospora grovesii]